jgi:hypothetical protein
LSVERHAPWALLGLALVAACSQPARPAPELHQVVPGEVHQSLGAEGYLVGAALFAELEDAFWSSSPATLDTGFRVRVGEVELLPEAITQVSPSRLDVRFPVGLPLGLHAVTVTTPAGRSATLPDALAVVAVSAPVLSIESAPDGGGQPVGPRQLEPGGAPLGLHAILRGVGGRFIQAVPSVWSLTSDVGTLTPSADGRSATLAPTRVGTTRVVATPLDGSAAATTGELRVAPVRFLGFASAPLRGEAGACLGPLVLETRDASGASAPVAQDTRVSLDARPSGVTFHPDATCSTAATAAVTLAPGGSRGSVWVRAEAAGTFTLQAATAWEGSATQPLEVARSTATRLAFAVLGAQTSGRPFNVSLTALDSRGQVDTAFSASASLTLVGGGTLACVSGCAAGLSTVPFSAGRWSGTVSVTGTAGDGRLLQAGAGTVAGESNAFSLFASRTPPLARPRARQPAARVGVAMTFDASASTDRESPASALRYSWDFSGTNPNPPPWTPWSASPTASFSYDTDGYRLVRLAVRDADGDIGYSAVLVVVVRPTVEVCVVDAPSVALDDGATDCTSARGTDGRLSLAEALRLHRAGQGARILLLAPGVTVSGPASFTLANDVWLMGSGASALDGVSFTVPAGISLVLGSLDYRGPSASVTVQGSGILALDTVELRGGAALDSAGTLYLLHSRLSGCTGACVEMTGASSSLFARESALLDSSVGVHASGCATAGVDLVGMLFARNTTGVRIDGTCVSSRLVGVTFDENATGLDLRAGTGHELRNALFTRNTTAATCTSATFSRGDALLGWSNGGDGCLPAPGISLRVDPRYVSPVEDDFRLEPWSPAVNAGATVNLDTNDAAPGDYTGSAPDLGGRETW